MGQKEHVFPEPGGLAPARILSLDGRPLNDAPASAEVRLACPTFSATAEMAGLSRVLGGYHIEADNVEGLAMGRKVADHTWPRYQAYFDGTAGAAAAGAVEKSAER